MDSNLIVSTGSKMYSMEELFFFRLLEPEITGLDMDIFVDDSSAYTVDRHPLLLFARNSLDSSVNEFFPMSISENPRLFDPMTDVKIPEKSLDDLKAFIIINRLLLTSFADGRYDFIEELLKPINKNL